MTGDPYEDASALYDDAKILTPDPPKRSKKIGVAALVLVGTLLALVMLANIAGLVTGRGSSNVAGRPTTISKKESDAFANQQRGQAAFLANLDRDRRAAKAQDVVMGYGKDALEEAEGVPARTPAQDAAMRNPAPPRQKTPAEEAAERAELERFHRRQNDLDSSPASLDFSDYFERQNKPDAQAVDRAPADPPDVMPVQGRSAIAEALALPPNESATPSLDRRKEAHDPKQDYVFDSSFGKLYRLMEDTILETVLVNRLAGAAAGPVITMITTDVYSQSGTHLLIPKGTRALGEVTAVGSLNQERLFVGFHRMIMPDGYSVSLDQFKGLDVVGQTGLRDLVNHHYVQIFGASLALAAVGAVTQIGNNSSFGTYDWGVTMRSNISEQLGQSAQRTMERFLNILPTFTIRERARVKIMLSNDLLLPDIKNHTMDRDL